MAKFIENDGAQLPPPYQFPQVSINSFRLRGTLDAINKLCENFLNIGTEEARGFRYVAASPFVDMEVLHYPRMKCTSPPFSDQGFSSQNEIYFRAMVAKLEPSSGTNFLSPTWIGWFVPYIFVDNPWSLISGREVIAFPKNLARFDFGTSQGTSPYPIKVSASVLNPYSPTTILRPGEVVNIQLGARARSKPPIGPWPWGDIDMSDIPSFLQDSLDVFRKIPKLSLIGLKQFRDAQDPSIACYQALVQSEFEATKTELGELPPADIAVAKFASLSIADNFGFPNTTLSPVWEYSLKCDFTFGNCRNVFIAT
jgi:hypothetical protein